jgi:apolipoprotein N-acyltransferase
MHQPTRSKTWRNLVLTGASGLLFPLGFAPFHLPGLAILSLALLFYQLNTQQTKRSACFTGFVFGFCMLGFGVSWIYVSIHTYGHLHVALAALLTLLFITFFSCYTALMAFSYSALKPNLPPSARILLFASVWFFSEYLRAHCVTGFPWLLLGAAHMDSPLAHLLPLIGVFGVGWVAAFISALLAQAVLLEQHPRKKMGALVLFVTLLIAPMTLQHKTWTQTDDTPLSVSIIQSNLSMRDKWDEALLWKIVNHYQNTASDLVQTNQLVIMPESAIPIPTSYAGDLLNTLHERAKASDSAILLGIPHPNSVQDGHYHNALVALGDAQGIYLKQHLVPFGEYIPKPFIKLNQWLHLPEPSIVPGDAHQPLITYQNKPLATLICYELAYPELLRKQLPEATWIASISDDGWFGHSLAVYQHLQMAQVLSKQTGRFQVLSNNDGLSSIIDNQGTITDTLPAFEPGVLKGKITPAIGATPWVHIGDEPGLLINSLFVIIIIGFQLILAVSRKRRYPKQLC